jgi:hypothetical protein
MHEVAQRTPTHNLHGTHAFQSQCKQARLRGQVQINTAQASGTVSLRMQNFTEITATGIDGSTTGFKSFDSNWIDLTSSLTAKLGRLQIAGTNAVVIGGAEVSIMLR